MNHHFSDKERKILAGTRASENGKDPDGYIHVYNGDDEYIISSCEKPIIQASLSNRERTAWQETLEDLRMKGFLKCFSAGITGIDGLYHLTSFGWDATDSIVAQG